jgi:hypothetical protein
MGSTFATTVGILIETVTHSLSVKSITVIRNFANWITNADIILTRRTRPHTDFTGTVERAVDVRMLDTLIALTWKLTSTAISRFTDWVAFALVDRTVIASVPVVAYAELVGILG